MYIVIPFSLFLLFTTDDTDDNTGIRPGLLYLMSLFALLYECIFYTPLGAIRKRGAQYIKMWRSGSWFDKCCLPLCYGMVYVHNIYPWPCLVLTLFILRDLLNALITRVPALAPLLAIVSWLHDKVINILSKCGSSLFVLLL